MGNSSFLFIAHCRQKQVVILPKLTNKSKLEVGNLIYT